jgi:hypothetical protein
LERTKRCLPCTDHEATLQAARKGREHGNKEYIDPSVIEGSAGITKAPVLKGSKRQPPTISLSDMDDLLQRSSNEAFQFEAFVTEPGDNSTSIETSNDRAFKLHDFILRSTKYQFKYVLLSLSIVYQLLTLAVFIRRPKVVQRVLRAQQLSHLTVPNSKVPKLQE